MTDWWGRVWMAEEIAQAIRARSDLLIPTTDFVELRFLQEAINERNRLRAAIEKHREALTNEMAPYGMGDWGEPTNGLWDALSPEDSK